MNVNGLIGHLFPLSILVKTKIGDDCWFLESELEASVFHTYSLISQQVITGPTLHSNEEGTYYLVPNVSFQTIRLIDKYREKFFLGF